MTDNGSTGASARERIAELTLEFVAQVAVADSIAELIPAMGQAGRRLVNATAGSFAERVGDEVRLRDLHRVADPIAMNFQTMSLSDVNPITDCVRQGTPMFYRSPAEVIAAYPHLSDSITQGGHGAYAVLPLNGRRVHGAVGLMWDGPRVLQSFERRALVRLAEVGGRTFPRVQQLEDDRGLAALETKLAAASSVSDVVEIVVPEGQKLLDATSGQLALIDGDRVIQVAALSIPRAHRGQWMDLGLDQHLPVCVALREQQTVFLTTAEDWQRYPDALAARDDMGVQALLVTPFTGTAAMAGALAFTFDRAEEANPRQRWLGERLAVMTGRAVQRAQMFDAERAMNTQLQGSGAKTLAAQRQLQHVLDSLFVSVGLLTPDGILLGANKTGFAATDMTAQDAVGQPFWELGFWPSQSRRILQDAVRRAAGGEQVRLDVSARLRGRLVPLDLQICPILDDLGTVESLVMSAIDISERKRSELAQHELLNRHRAISRRLQRNLLPLSLPTLPGAEVEARYRAAGNDLDVGGDWYDAFWLDNGYLALIIGDIVGRGIDAAAATGQIRAATRALADVSDGPADVVARLDHFASTIPAATAATMIYAQVDLGSGEVRLCRAGHIPPLVVDPSGTTRLYEDNGSVPLGVVDGGERGEATLTVPRGAHLLLCTDGLVERRGETLTTGLSRLSGHAGALAGERALADSLEALIDAQAVAGQVQDDLCALVLRRG